METKCFENKEKVKPIKLKLKEHYSKFMAVVDRNYLVIGSHKSCRKILKLGNKSCNLHDRENYFESANFISQISRKWHTMFEVQTQNYQINLCFYPKYSNINYTNKIHTLLRIDPTKQRKENPCGRCIVFHPKKICKEVRFNANLVIIRLLYALHPFLKNATAKEHNLSKKRIITGN